uniref:Uncharacterized protein n=1 Tax=Anguilla anguilla TaxID=7936 RepID=A0A0E9X671_ANGAN
MKRNFQSLLRRVAVTWGVYSECLTSGLSVISCVLLSRSSSLLYYLNIS